MLAWTQYAQDYDEMTVKYRYPDPLYWPDFLQPYVKNSQIWTCPSRTNITYGYGLNNYNDQWSLGSYKYPAETVIIQDSYNRYAYYPGTPVTWDTFLMNSNDGSTARAPHNDGMDFGFADGHAKWMAAAAAFNSNPSIWERN